MDEKLDCRIPRSFLFIVILFLGIKGRINFLQLERFTGKCEQRFRYFFERSFDFLNFSRALINLYVNGKKALAFDPSYISKSGKRTPGVGYFWSGVAGKAKWGLELCGIAALDINRRSAYHLLGFQTIDLRDEETLISFYVRKLLEQKDVLLKITNWLVVDAYFSKATFIEPITKSGFQVVSRLRDDAVLQYVFIGEQKKEKGRHKKYDGKVDFDNLNLKYANLVSDLDEEKIYSFITYSKSSILLKDIKRLPSRNL